MRLGTRGSALARWQANWVAARLRAAEIEVELVLITTSGDTSTQPITEAGGQGLFTKEIQRALLEDRIDVAVHSLKDLPTVKIEGLQLSAVPEREQNRDALVARDEMTLETLTEGSVVGTGSRRRRSQLLFHRKDLDVRDIRGNVDTRLKKLDDGDYDAIVLAEAGLRRLELHSRISEVLDRQIMLPAVGQGALGIETRADDAATIEQVSRLNDADTHAAVVAERALLARLQAGCLAPVGAWARVEGSRLVLDAVVLSPDGSKRLVFQADSETESAESLGFSVADQLLADGAAELIRISHS